MVQKYTVLGSRALGLLDVVVSSRVAATAVKSIHDQRYIEVVALLRKARERTGLTQRDLAKLLGRPQSYVSKVETCERRLDYIELLQMCRAIGVALGDVTPAEYSDLLRSAKDG